MQLWPWLAGKLCLQGQDFNVRAFYMSKRYNRALMYVFHEPALRRRVFCYGKVNKTEASTPDLLSRGDQLLQNVLQTRTTLTFQHLPMIKTPLTNLYLRPIRKSERKSFRDFRKTPKGTDIGYARLRTLSY